MRDRSKPDNQDTPDILKGYFQGKSPQMIATDLKLNVEKVKSVLKRRGLTGTSGPRGHRFKRIGRLRRRADDVSVLDQDLDIGFGDY